MNLTKTVRKAPISLDLLRVGAAMEDTQHKPQPKYDEEGKFVSGRPWVPTASTTTSTIIIYFCI